MKGCLVFRVVVVTFKVYKKSKDSWVPVAHAYNPTHLGVEIWRIVVRAQPGHIVLETPISKNNQSKNELEVLAQVVEHLPCKCEALS
jgi:hypothetical protein